MNLDLDDLGLETVVIVGAGVGSLDAGLSVAADIMLLSDLLGGNLETGLIVASAADGVVIVGKSGPAKVFES